MGYVVVSARTGDLALSMCGPKSKSRVYRCCAPGRSSSSRGNTLCRMIAFERAGVAHWRSERASEDGLWYPKY